MHRAASLLLLLAAGLAAAHPLVGRRRPDGLPTIAEVFHPDGGIDDFSIYHDKVRVELLAVGAWPPRLTAPAPRRRASAVVHRGQGRRPGDGHTLPADQRCERAARHQCWLAPLPPPNSSAHCAPPAAARQRPRATAPCVSTAPPRPTTSAPATAPAPTRSAVRSARIFPSTTFSSPRTTPTIALSSRKFYIHQQGGGWCESLDSCLGRSKTDLGSSKNYPATASLGSGYFSSDPTVNPMMSVGRG